MDYSTVIIFLNGRDQTEFLIISRLQVKNIIEQSIPK